MKAQLKREARETRRPGREEFREYRRATRRCFWTWPFGHAFVPPEQRGGTWRCLNCPKELETSDGIDSYDPVVFSYKNGGGVHFEESSWIRRSGRESRPGGY